MRRAAIRTVLAAVPAIAPARLGVRRAERPGRPRRRRPGRRPGRLRRAGAGHARPTPTRWPSASTGDEEDARDVVQEAYLRAYRAIGRFRGDAQFTTWLYRITANCAVDSPRPARAATATTSWPTTPRWPTTDPDADPEATADAGALRDRLDRRPRRAAPPPAGRRRAPRRLRPAPRGHRRRARHHRAGGQGPAPPGPPPAAGAAVPAARRGGATRRPCGVTDLRRRRCAGVADGRRAAPTGRARRHVEGCLRCQAELAQYRKLLQGPAHAAHRGARAPPPACVADILAALEEAGERPRRALAPRAAAGSPTSAASPWPRRRRRRRRRGHRAGQPRRRGGRRRAVGARSRPEPPLHRLATAWR